jgi:hypothetical protein
MGKLIYSSAGGAVRRTLHTDPSDPYRFTQETEIVYPDDFADRNRQLGEEQNGRHMKLVARGVPLFVWEQSEREGWDEKRWAQWLNDPDNRAFRVWQGTV